MTKDEKIKELQEKTKCDDVFIEYLDSIKYFDCPAAMSHHSNYRGGLFDHSKAVADNLTKLTDTEKLNWSREESPYVIGYLHDVCKCNDYVFADVDGEFMIDWNKNRAYGHGHKSLEMLIGHFYLTPEEITCIRYHMGAYVDKSEWSDLNREISQNPNVLWTHTADMIASQIQGI